MKTTLRLSLTAAALALLFIYAGIPLLSAQIPNTLFYSIPAPYGTPQSGAQLGSSVVIDGIYTVAGAPFDETGAHESGVVKVFNSTTGALLYVLPNPTPADFDEFGTAVAISGTLVAVGHPNASGPGRAGAVNVYDLSGTAPTVPIFTLTISTTVGNDKFGAALAMAGTRLAVGAPSRFTGGTVAGAAFVFDLGSATPTIPVATLNNPTPAVGENFGNAIALSSTRVVVGCTGDSTGASGAGSAYVYDLTSATPTVPVVTLNNPTPAAGDRFGTAVAVAGTLVVVTAPNDDTIGLDAGNAYAYDLGSATPTVPVTTLVNPNASSGDNFGNAVAMSGTRVAVGAYRDFTGPGGSGGAYVYDLGGATPAVPVAILNNPGPPGTDPFGVAVALSGTHVAVGASSADSAAIDAGIVYVYDLSGATPTVPAATLSDTGPGAGDNFGVAVAISGTRVVVGALLDAPNATDVGIVYVYDLANATPTVPTLTLPTPTPGTSEAFGAAVAIAGTHVVVGCPFDNAGAITPGAAYVYDLAGATPTVPIFVLSNPSPASGDRFGVSVAISGMRVVVGANQDDTGATDAGSVYVYDLGGATPTAPVSTLNNPGPPASDHFGTTVSVSGTLVAVGAPADSTGAISAGSAYVYDMSSATPSVPVATMNNPSPGIMDAFGTSVALSGTRMVVGAIRGDGGSADAGIAYVYDLTRATPTVPMLTLNNPSPAASDNFGGAVAISGARVVVGASRDSTGASNAGSAYVFDVNAANPTIPVATLNNPTPGPGDAFGSAVAIDGVTVVVGTPSDESAVYQKGSTYVFGATFNPNDKNYDGLLDSWEFAHFGDTAFHEILADNEHDGLTNLLEEAFGSDPFAPDTTAAPAVVNEGGYLTITITKHPGVIYQVQSAATPAPAAFSVANTTVLIDNATTLKVRDNALIGTTPGRFMRVQVTAAP